MFSAFLFIAVGIFIGSTLTCATALYLENKSMVKMRLRGWALEHAMENDIDLETAKKFIHTNNL